MIDKRCGTCRHFTPARSEKTGRILPSASGVCGFVVEWPAVPECLMEMDFNSRPIVMRFMPKRRTNVLNVSGEHCPVWSKK